MKRRSSISIGQFALLIALTVGMHLLHELSHALTAVVFGEHGSMGTNTVRYYNGIGTTALIWVTAAGPIVTVLLALLAFNWRSKLGTSVLFIAFAQRAMAAGMSLNHANDEARLSQLLGLGYWTLFAVTVTLTATLFIIRFRERKLGWKWLVVNWLAFSIGITLMVFADNVLPRWQF